MATKKTPPKKKATTKKPTAAQVKKAQEEKRQKRLEAIGCTVKEKATNVAEEAVTRLVEHLNENPLAKNLKLKVKDGKGQDIEINLVGPSGQLNIFTLGQENEISKAAELYTNLAQAKQELIVKYEAVFMRTLLDFSEGIEPKK